MSAPIASLFLGYWFKLTTFAVANAVSLGLAFALLPLVIARMAREPESDVVRNLPRYALLSLIPITLYNVSRVPMNPLLGVVFWDHWYDYGTGATGLAMNTWGSLVAGTLLHTLQGWVLAMGFYVLFRPTLGRAVLYGCALAALYTVLFPKYVLVDYRPAAPWYFVVWWAHIWMGVGLWAGPRLLSSPRFVARLKRPLPILAVALVSTLPYTFVFTKVATWQFPTQNAIDQRTFEKLETTLTRPPSLEAVGLVAGPGAGEARYRMTLRLGSRTYTDYIGATKTIDIAALFVRGTLVHEGRVIAHCAAYEDALASPADITNHDAYIKKVHEVAYVEVDAECVGPSEAAADLARRLHESGPGVRVTASWSAELRAVGDRITEDRIYRGVMRDIPLVMRSDP